MEAASKSSYVYKWKNMRTFLLWYAKLMDIKRPDDWYHISKEDVLKRGGKEFDYITRHGLWKSLEFSFPEVDWQPWRFQNVTDAIWNSRNNAKKFLDWASNRLHITNTIHWNLVEISDIKKLGGDGLLGSHGYNLVEVLRVFTIPHVSIR
jgi:hypothetical protein